MTEVNQSTPKEVLTKKDCDEVGKMASSHPRAYAKLMDLFYDRGSFDPDNPHMTSFQEGQRDVMRFMKRCKEDKETRSNAR